MPSWLSNSELFAGLVLEGRRSSSEASAETLHPPYDEVIRHIQKDGAVDIDDLIEAFGVEVIQPAISAAHSVNGLGDKINWGSNLKRLYNEQLLANELERAVKKLNRGDSVDYNRIKNSIQSVENAEEVGLKPLSQVKDDTVMLVPSGYAPIDKFFGGVPKQGIIALIGESGVGKTFFQSRLVGAWVATHKKECAAIYTLEMQEGELKERLLISDSRLKEKDLANRVLINDKWVSIEDICREVASRKDIKLVVIDFINLLIRGTISDEAMGSIYIELMRLAKQQHVTILAIGQLKQNFTGGIPHPQDAYYGKLAFQLGWSVWAIFNPNSSFTRFSRTQVTEIPTFDEDHVYIIGWKQRGKWPKKYPGPGAIVIERDEERIWGDVATWNKIQGGA